MVKLDYQKIGEQLLSQLPAKQREVVERRFGLKTGRRAAEGEPRFQRETLEAIGKSHKICRERVRQIEKAAFSKMKKNAAAVKYPARVFGKHLRDFGGAREESVLLEELGGPLFKAHAYFLLVISGEFARGAESDGNNAFWAVDSQFQAAAKNFIALAMAKLNETKKLATPRELAALGGLKKPVAESYLGISKEIQKNKDGFYGLRNWPEVNPKGIKDKIYLLLKKSRNPLHFSDVAKGIQGSLVQTVHNELIRDKRFVLIGRGKYALKEWGYVEGDVKDVINNILGSENRPLTKSEILEKVMKQRQIKENTVLMNLSNKKFFSRDNDGRYWRAAEGEPRLTRTEVQQA